MIIRSYRIENNQMEIYHFPELLTYEECDELISMTDKKLGTNRKKQNTQSPQIYKLDTSTDLSKTINERLSKVVGVSEDFGEDIFIQKFTPDFEYPETVDYISPNQKDYLFETKGQRVWSMQIWLNSLNDGGHLTFKSIDRSVKPSERRRRYGKTHITTVVLTKTQNTFIILLTKKINMFCSNISEKGEM